MFVLSTFFLENDFYLLLSFAGDTHAFSPTGVLGSEPARHVRRKSAFILLKIGQTSLISFNQVSPSILWRSAIQRKTVSTPSNSDSHILYERLRDSDCLQGCRSCFVSGVPGTRSLCEGSMGGQ